VVEASLICGGFGNGDDAIYGDDGDDYLYAADDGIADLLSGGGGSDLCVVGPEDLAYTSGCEVSYVQVTLIELFAAATEEVAPRAGAPFRLFGRFCDSQAC
jgi:Ca2+-binding RTX toxin-like protein